MLDRRHLIALVEHDVGLLEGRLGVAVAQLLVIVFAVILERILRIRGVDRRCARLQRFLDVEDRGQLIVGDAHQRHRLERRAFAGRDDAEDRLAFVAHDVRRQRRLVILAELNEAQQRVEIDRHVGGPDDPFHARRARRRRIVDRADARMRMRAAQDFQVQQVSEAVIVIIRRGAGDVPQHVLPLRRLADFYEIVVALVGEDVFAEFQHGVVLRRGGGCRRARHRVSR